MDQSSNKTDDTDGYKSPPATLAIIEPPKGPYNRTRIKYDEEHECPMCMGKGYVQIVNEKSVPRKRDALGRIPGSSSASD